MVSEIRSFFLILGESDHPDSDLVYTLRPTPSNVIGNTIYITILLFVPMSNRKTKTNKKSKLSVSSDPRIESRRKDKGFYVYLSTKRSRMTLV